MIFFTLETTIELQGTVTLPVATTIHMPREMSKEKKKIVISSRRTLFEQRLICTEIVVTDPVHHAAAHLLFQAQEFTSPNEHGILCGGVQARMPWHVKTIVKDIHMRFRQSIPEHDPSHHDDHL